MNKFVYYFTLFIIVSIGLTLYIRQTASPKSKYEKYCGSCHLLPTIKNIPKHLWKRDVLPEMAARMGHRYNGFNPYKHSMEENHYLRRSNGYPKTPIIDSIEWQQIHDYILNQAPNKVLNLPPRKGRSSELIQFKTTQHVLNQTRPLSGVTSITFDSLRNSVFIGNNIGQIFELGESLPFKKRFQSPIISCILEDSTFYLTEIGTMMPKETPRGAIYELKNDTVVNLLYKNLHRPVYTKSVDLNNNGKKEFLICEFGFLTGELSILLKKDSIFEKRTLIPLPGSIKVEVVDMNADGKKDIIVLLSQGREGIYILYQKDDLSFDIDYSIKMQPEYGLSWFELVDYNMDGYLDIVLVNGDNADYSYFLKPYHGIRLFLNNGNNKFEEKWFYPINGATKVLAEDFDFDGDLDFAVLSFFPDFHSNIEEGFVYLENKDSKNYEFIPYSVKQSKNANWMVMEKGDFDQDGDTDILLGNYPILAPIKSMKDWKFDILHLENMAANN